jgi:hypothetical protein
MPGKRAWLEAATAVITVAVVLAAFTQWRRMHPNASPVVQPKSAAMPVSGRSLYPNVEDHALRILAGNHPHEYIDRSGHTWLPDRFFTGGTPFSRPDHQVLRARDPEIFTTGREGQFRYEIPVPSGVYELHLLFAETQVPSENDRRTSFSINDGPIQDLDVLADAGGADTATTKIYHDVRPAADGKIHLKFYLQVPDASYIVKSAFLNALEIFPGLPGRIRPIRFTASTRPYVDREGRLWLADQYFQGGTILDRRPPENSPADPNLYRVERYGHFSYSVPVAEDGRYALSLYFRECYYGAQNPGKEGVGSRVFDVYCNGTALLERAAELNPADSAVYYHPARALELSGKEAESRKAFAKFKQLQTSRLQEEMDALKR